MSAGLSMRKRRSLSRKLYDIDMQGLVNEIMWLGSSQNVKVFKQGYPEYHRVLFETPLTGLPLLINDEDVVVREIAVWRLESVHI